VTADLAGITPKYDARELHSQIAAARIPCRRRGWRQWAGWTPSTPRAIHRCGRA